LNICRPLLQTILHPSLLPKIVQSLWSVKRLVSAHYPQRFHEIFPLSCKRHWLSL
jgi:hypothetical protein